MIVTKVPTIVQFQVYGEPAPQGSKNARVNKAGRPYVKESSERVKPWRAAVAAAAAGAAPGVHLAGPIGLIAHFYLHRPTGHYGTGRNAGRLRPSAPPWPARLPDLDKLLRSTMDGISQSGLWADDSRVVAIEAHKLYAAPGQPLGALLIVTERTTP